MKRALFLSTTILVGMLGACVPQSEVSEAENGRTEFITDDHSATDGLALSGVDSHDTGSDEGGEPAGILDDFINSEVIEPFGARNREPLSMGSLAGALAGEPFYVSFDRCPYDDRGWQEMNDPLAGIRCGYNYYASVDGNGGLAFTGPLEPFGSIFTAPGAISEDGVTVWGVTLGIRLDGTVIDGSNNAIGHIALGEAPASE